MIPDTAAVSIVHLLLLFILQVFNTRYQVPGIKYCCRRNAKTRNASLLQAFHTAYIVKVKLSSSRKARRKLSGLTGRIVLTASRDDDAPPPVAPPRPTSRTTPPSKPPEKTVVVPAVVVGPTLPLAVLLAVVVVAAASSVTPAFAAW